MAAVLTIETTVEAIATALKIPVHTAEEVIRRIFLQSKPVPLPPKFRYVSEWEIQPFHIMSSECLTVHKRHNKDCNILDVASLHAYIVAAVKSVMDLSAWQDYTGPKAPVATIIGNPFEPAWVPHYSLPGKYAVYPDSKEQP